MPKALFKTLLVSSVACLPAFSGLNAAQCYAPSDPVRLTKAEQRAVVLNVADNPTVFAAPHDFGLKRTLTKILDTAGVASASDAQIEGFLDSLLAGLKDDHLANDKSGLTLAVAPRPGEAALTAHDLLASGGDNEMKPVGLFNRLDLTPGDFSNCGEFRIVYAKNSHQTGLTPPTDAKPQFDDRMTLIFEAALPNPDPNGSPATCQSAYGLWKSFSGTNPDGSTVLPDDSIGTTLEHFYYDGGPIGASVPFEPVVHLQHYGLPNGQVRANAFVQPATTHPGSPFPPQQWHLRQWRTGLDQGTSQPLFIAEPVGENPVPAFFGGSDADGAMPADLYARLKGLFQNDFVRTKVGQLTAVDTLAAIPVGTQATVADLIDNVGVDIDDAFYDVESQAGPPAGLASDDPAPRAKGTGLDTAIQGKLAPKLAPACGLTTEHVLNRMGAMTCGGCHQFSNGKEIAPGIRWPLSLTFVQINEAGQMSNLLLDRFLPFRFHLMDETVPAALPPETPALAQNVTGLQRARTVRANLKAVLATPNKSAATVSTAIDLSKQVRQFDQGQVGAFVQFRKPD